MSLFETQKWFASVITRPIHSDSRLERTPELETESARFITPSRTLTPLRRIELYHQQYWWRLLRCLQTNFPFVTRLVGYERFNRTIGIPYLHANPSTHWSLCRLGDSLPLWMEQHHRGLLADASKIDRATEESFWVAHRPPAPFARMSAEAALITPFALQPHVRLFALNSDLFTLRAHLLTKSVEHWQELSLPSADRRQCYFVLFRNLGNIVSWKELSAEEYLMLAWLQEGLTINQTCEKIESLEGEFLAEAEEKIPFWFREWTALEWLILKE